MFFTKSYFIDTSRECDALVVTSEVRWGLRESSMKEGLVVLSLPCGGAGWALLEPIEEVIEDLKTHLLTIQGAKGEGKNKAKEVIKTAPLLQGAFLQSQLILPIVKGNFLFDPKQEIFLFDFTDSGKRREFTVSILGEEEGKKNPPQTAQRR